MAPNVFGAAVPASYLRVEMDSMVGAARGNVGDALNISEAGAAGADLFITGDRATIGATFGPRGDIFLPRSGGVVVPFTTF
jgi:hypothetical protein